MTWSQGAACCTRAVLFLIHMIAPQVRPFRVLAQSSAPFSKAFFHIIWVFLTSGWGALRFYIATSDQPVSQKGTLASHLALIHRVEHLSLTSEVVASWTFLFFAPFNLMALVSSDSWFQRCFFFLVFVFVLAFLASVSFI